MTRKQLAPCSGSLQQSFYNAASGFKQTTDREDDITARKKLFGSMEQCKSGNHKIGEKHHAPVSS